MRTRMVEEREGEHLGPIDWDQTKWPFEVSPKQLEELRKVEADREGFVVTDDGGWPRFGWQRVLVVGMYDGWPYWKPGPALLTTGTLGPEWMWANNITDIRRWPPQPMNDPTDDELEAERLDTWKRVLGE